jgi:hypothetical protein
VTVYRLTQGQRFPYTATARWAEYCPDNAPMWKRMPHTMLGKCAEALALGKPSRSNFGPLHAREEMDQADNRTAPAESARLVVEERQIAGNAHAKDGDSVEAPAVIDTESGAELAPAPDGYHYITGYQFNSPWHEATALRWDAKGGSLKVSTKLKIGELLATASNMSVPAKLDVTMKRQSVGEAYLNKIALWVADSVVNIGGAESDAF